MNVWQTAFVFCDPLFLHGRAEADEKDPCAAFADEAEDAIVFFSGFFEISVVRTDDRKRGKPLFLLFGGKSGDARFSSEKEDGVFLFSRKAENMLPEVHACDFFRERCFQNFRGKDDARTVGEQEVCTAQQMHDIFIFGGELGDLCIRCENGDVTFFFKCLCSKSDSFLHGHVIETESAYIDFFHKRFLSPCDLVSPMMKVKLF